MQEQVRNDEVRLSDYGNMLLKRKALIIGMCLISVLATVAVSLMLPKYYKSESVIIASGSESGGLGAALSALPLAGAFAGSAGIQTPADKVMVILKSRTIAEAVIQRFELLRVFNADDWDAGKRAWTDPAKPPLMQDAVKKLKNISTFSKSREGAITVAVEWKDPKLAADMANHYIAALASFLNEKSITITTQVVDKAVPAERKSSPKITLNAMLAALLGLLIGVIAAFILESRENNRSA